MVPFHHQKCVTGNLQSKMKNVSRFSKKSLCFHRWTRKRFAIFASLHQVVKIAAITCTCSLVQCKTDSVFGQSKNSQTNLDSIELDEIEIAEALPLSVTPNNINIQILQKQDIQINPASGLDELLENIPGIDIRQRGNESQSDISIRGGGFDQVLILVNGVNLTDPQTGHFNLDLPISLDNIQQIDVLKGSAARIWGSHAFSGAINIITTAPIPPQKPNSFNFKNRFSMGSFGQTHAESALRYVRNRWQNQLVGTYKKSDGYRSNTDYESLGFHADSHYSSADWGDFQVQIGGQWKQFGANSFYSFDYPNQFEKTQTIYSSAGWRKKSNNSTFSAQLSHRLHHDQFELFRAFEAAPIWYTTHNYHLNNTLGALLKWEHLWSVGKTTMGGEWRKNVIQSTVLGKILSKPKNDPYNDDLVFTRGDQRELGRLFVDQTVQFNDLHISGGLSCNFNEWKNPFFTGGLDFSYHQNAQIQYVASWNHSVRLPTFTDLYYKAGQQIGNPDLKPEKSSTFELGADFKSKNFCSAISLYFRDGKDIIDWVKHRDSTKWTSQNSRRILAFGGEFMMEYKNDRNVFSTIRFSQTFQTLNKDAQQFDSKYALDYLKYRTSVQVNHALLKYRFHNRLHASWTATYQYRAGNYTAYGSNILTNYRPFETIDLKVYWKGDSWEIFTTGKNLTNKQYADFGGLVQPGASILCGIAYTLSK